MSRTFNFRDSSIALALVGICVFFGIMEPKFLDSRNLSLLMTELSITATLAMGMLDRAKPINSPILIRGDLKQTGDVTPRGLVEVLCA